MVTVSRLALTARENCVIILYSGQEERGGIQREEDEVERRDKRLKRQRRVGAVRSGLPIVKICTRSYSRFFYLFRLFHHLVEL